MTRPVVTLVAFALLMVSIGTMEGLLAETRNGSKPGWVPLQPPKSGEAKLSSPGRHPRTMPTVDPCKETELKVFSRMKRDKCDGRKARD